MSEGRYRKLAWCLIVPLTILVSGLTACTSLPRKPVPVANIYNAELVGMPGVRAWGGEVSPDFQADLVQSISQEPVGEFINTVDGSINYRTLALSGGGSNGAFGAGIIYGWTHQGTRPTFKIVTGISTGALIAPFAFLGPKYDEQLKAAYTTIKTKDVFKLRGLFKIPGNESFTETGPLSGVIKNFISEELMQDVAQAHLNGRRLYIGSTAMDAQRLAVWNMGAIAVSGQPNALEIFRKVLLASASVPAAFPPVYFDVEINGQHYDEMHTDGGTITQVFFHYGVLDLKGAGKEAGLKKHDAIRSDIYIIRNGKLGPEPEQIKRRLKNITSRAVDTLIKSQAVGDLFRIYAYSKQQPIDFHYVGIPEDFMLEGDEAFDPAVMNALFDLGYQMITSGNPWYDAPPGLKLK